MKIPRQTRYRKVQRMLGFCNSKRKNTSSLVFGLFGIKALHSGRIGSNTIETMRRTLTRRFRRTGKLWVRIFPHLATTAKPAEVRMGKGKGNPKTWVACIPAGQVLFEFTGVSPRLAKQAAESLRHKIGMKIQLVHQSK